MKRYEYFEQLVSDEIRSSRKYARGFLEGLMEGEDGFSLEDALKIVIKTMGVKEFAQFTHQAPSNVVDFLKGRRHPKISTLDQYLKPFGLKVVLKVKAA